MVWTTIWSHAQRGVFAYSEHQETVEILLKQITPIEQIRLVFANDYGDQIQSIRRLTIQSNECMERVKSFSLAPGEFYQTQTIPIDPKASKWKISFEATPLESGYAFNDADFLPEKGRADFCTGLLTIEADVEGECILALGDSLTEGATWTAPLQRQLRQKNLFLVNQGINGSFLLKDSSGNEATTSNNSLFYGYASFKRLKRCLDSHQNVKKVIIFLGANDLIHGELDLQRFQAAINQLIDYCIERSIDYRLCTLTPCLGYPGMDATKENTRQQINHWLRKKQETLWDFAAMVEEKGQLFSSYDSGDHLHLNAIGGLVIARQISSDFFKGE
ncbi:GDSL-type esterase/lipase family protein [Enterococcus hermanniensis]|uniref:SGNH hydrolase-type esterase domain-containing protein n=1 Tax=Enterococcus hermanniensis TaxID=249189 RepID=A0A1L8TLC7_9ENTE|nr:GDSL-type esterase/lipase family protein [Enterococcus hermanniensis]OJG45131.1 hypothetical protein RV04_GL002445 [Enterococcus hermanniensis]